MWLGFLEKNIFIGDSAATSHMTNRKLGVYDLVPINGSVMIGNGKSISVNPNRDSPNGYPTVTLAELQPVTLSH